MSKCIDYIQAFAVIRVDEAPEGTQSHVTEYESGGELLPAPGPPNITVKEVVCTAEEARREVMRLNNLNADKECTYYWQSTHVYPNGGSHGSANADS